MSGLTEPMPAGLPVMEVVCLVLRDARGRVLATRRPPGKSLGGLWEFPGGKVDPGEDPQDALRREIREELGFDVGALALLTPVAHTYPFAVIRLIPYLSECSAHPDIRLHEHTALRWVSHEAAAALEWAPADLPVLAELGRSGPSR
jgi:8-oxo-dGTP diphosphatase